MDVEDHPYSVYCDGCESQIIGTQIYEFDSFFTTMCEECWNRWESFNLEAPVDGESDEEPEIEMSSIMEALNEVTS